MLVIRSQSAAEWCIAGEQAGRWHGRLARCDAQDFGPSPPDLTVLGEDGDVRIATEARRVSFTHQTVIEVHPDSIDDAGACREPDARG